MSVELENCDQEIKALIDERTALQESIEKNKVALADTSSVSERKRLVDEIQESQAQLNKVSLLLAGAERRKEKIDVSIQAMAIKDKKLRVRETELEIIKAHKIKYFLLLDILAIEDNLLELEAQRAIKNSDTKLGFPGLDNMDLSMRYFSLRSFIAKNDLFEIRIPEAQRIFSEAEGIIKKEIKELQ